MVYILFSVNISRSTYSNETTQRPSKNYYPKLFLTSKDNRSYWIWVSEFLLGDPTGGLNNDPQHFGRALIHSDKTTHTPLHRGN